MAQSQTTIPPDQTTTMRKLEQGRYTATDLRWGMTLDLSGLDGRSLIAYGFHGRENQQARASRSFFFLAPRLAAVQKKLIVVLPRNMIDSESPSPGPRACGATIFAYYPQPFTFNLTYFVL